MSHFDMNMMAMMGLILLVGGVSVTFIREMMVPTVGLILLLVMVWGDDICSRSDRLQLYGGHIEREGEMICKDDHGHPLLISKAKGWEHQGQYLFKENRGIDLLEDQCEIPHHSEPHCISITTQIMIGTGIVIGILGWMGWMFHHENKSRIKIKSREERKEKIRKGAEEMAELYRTDPELKEWSQFAGDYYESSDDYMKGEHHEQKNG